MTARQALIVEDDQGLRLIYNRVLSDLGYDVIEAPTGAQALEVLENSAPEIIFLDMLLPQVNGMAVLDFIGQKPHLRHMQVVIVSSNKQFDIHPDIPNPVEFILKPIRPAQIRELARSLQT